MLQAANGKSANDLRNNFRFIKAGSGFDVKNLEVKTSKLEKGFALSLADGFLIYFFLDDLLPRQSS